MIFSRTKLYTCSKHNYSAINTQCPDCMKEVFFPKREIEICPNCKESIKPCACMRNICQDCGKPVGNITFTVCDKCWEKSHMKK
jgi:predicted amidophosphoribosyltransferase